MIIIIDNNYYYYLDNILIIILIIILILISGFDAFRFHLDNVSCGLRQHNFTTNHSSVKDEKNVQKALFCYEISRRETLLNYMALLIYRSISQEDGWSSHV